MMKKISQAEKNRCGATLKECFNDLWIPGRNELFVITRMTNKSGDTHFLSFYMISKNHKPVALSYLMGMYLNCSSISYDMKTGSVKVSGVVSDPAAYVVNKLSEMAARHFTVHVLI